MINCIMYSKLFINISLLKIWVNEDEDHLNILGNSLIISRVCKILYLYRDNSGMFSYIVPKHMNYYVNFDFINKKINVIII